MSSSDPSSGRGSGSQSSNEMADRRTVSGESLHSSEFNLPANPVMQRASSAQSFFSNIQTTYELDQFTRLETLFGNEIFPTEGVSSFLHNNPDLALVLNQILDSINNASQNLAHEMRNLFSRPSTVHDEQHTQTSVSCPEKVMRTAQTKKALRKVMHLKNNETPYLQTLALLFNLKAHSR